MILEYMPYRACEPILRTLISVTYPFCLENNPCNQNCFDLALWQLVHEQACMGCAGCIKREGEPGHEQSQAVCERVLRRWCRQAHARQGSGEGQVRP